MVTSTQQAPERPIPARGLLQRVFDAYRVNSSAVAVALLVLFNLVPLAGVLWLGWDLLLILALYWVENGVVGVINIYKILTAEGTAAPTGWTMNGRPISQMSRPAVAGFFSFHYGLFWVVHGVFVFTLIPALASDPSIRPDGTIPAPLTGLNVDLGVLALSAIGLAISHGVSFWTNYIGRHEYKTLSPSQVMIQPYGRLVIMHLTILLGAFVTSSWARRSGRCWCSSLGRRPWTWHFTCASTGRWKWPRARPDRADELGPRS